VSPEARLMVETITSRIAMTKDEAAADRAAAAAERRASVLSDRERMAEWLEASAHPSYWRNV